MEYNQRPNAAARSGAGGRLVAAMATAMSIESPDRISMTNRQSLSSEMALCQCSERNYSGCIFALHAVQQVPQGQGQKEIGWDDADMYLFYKNV